jgi:predicted nucleic acid-binding protein
MIVLDTNVFIYLANGKLSSASIAHDDIAYASITRIEALGYSKITAEELLLLSALFEEAHDLPLNNAVVDAAIALRQAHKMTLGDSVVAATALEFDIELWTANIDDFRRIRGIKLVNPLA